jgi:hypothetical protein
VTVAAQGSVNSIDLGRLQYAGTTQIALALLAHSTGQVAGTGLAMLDLSGRSQSKLLFRAFMGFLLGHGRSLAYII